MEEEMSTGSNATIFLAKDTSDSNSSSHPLHRNKRPRHDISIPASRFKGVVGQPNGRWGAQIYANHQRIWLGTFKSEREAAMAYDSAAIKVRSGDSYKNFPWTNITIQEPYFQSHFSTQAVLNMIKDGSYSSKFVEFFRTQFLSMEKLAGSSLVHKHGRRFLRRQLFQKELTPSDVGKLNRLVIPKKYAVRYFPNIFGDVKRNLGDDGLEDVQLVFYDKSMRSWKFRYCYWKSSQSFVFTRGWNRFVKETELKEKDTIIFSSCLCRDRLNQIQSFCMIGVAYKDRVDSNASGSEDTNEDAARVPEELQLDLEHDIIDVGDEEDSQELQLDVPPEIFEVGHDEDSEERTLGLQLGINARGVDNEKEFEEVGDDEDSQDRAFALHLGINVGGVNNEKEFEEEKDAMAVESTKAEKNGLRIFGVQIC